VPFEIRLIYLLVITNVILRFFTNLFGVLPKFFNLSDVVITLLLTLLVLGKRNSPTFSAYSRRLVVFCIVLFIGALLNFGSLYAPAAIAQTLMLAEPILLFVSLGKLPIGLPEFRKYNRILRTLVIIQFVLGVLEFPIFLYTGESEAIVGTFNGNAEQYTGFLLLGVCYYLGLIKVEPSKKMRYGAFVFAILVLIPFVDNKASWLGVIFTLYFLMTRLGHVAGSRAKHLITFSALVIAGYIVAVSFSSSISKFAGLSSALDTGNFWNLGKMKAYEDVYEAFTTYPQMALVGSGPGTFYSRASGQYYLITDDFFSNPSDYRRTFNARTSNSMGGVIQPTAAVEPFYKRFFVKYKIFSVGSAQVDSPFSAYAGLLGETGLIGFAIYMSFYVGAFRRLKSYWERFHNDVEVFPLLTASLGFMIYTLTVSVYNPWLETGRMTTILWSMIGMLCVYAEAVTSADAAAQSLTENKDMRDSVEALS